MSVVDPFAKARQALVEESILSSGVTDQRVLKAFLTCQDTSLFFASIQNKRMLMAHCR